MKQKRLTMLLTVGLLCSLAMAWVDGVLQPGYGPKSAIKICLFFLLPLLISRFDGEIRFGELFRLRKQGIGLALILGLGVYGLIVGGYFLIRGIFDFSMVAGKLSENAGVTRDNFLWVSLYISFVNSLLEEFFFRGFLFLNLNKLGRRGLAYGFSAAVFALYHAGMLTDWFSPLLFILLLLGLGVAGLMFDYLNEKQETIYVSWLVHMFANFAINTVGFILL